MRDHPFDEVMAERLFTAVVTYLVTAMEKWGEGLEMCCGRLVDIAVHVFILDTKNYREFCARHFDGRFLEHIPEIEFKYDGSVERTAHIIAENGFPVDWKLWERDFAKCGPCGRARTATDRSGTGGSGCPRRAPGLVCVFMACRAWATATVLRHRARFPQGRPCPPRHTIPSSSGTATSRTGTGRRRHPR
ncbi:hypothetical protein ACFVZC_18300 [Streptomyces marokkonensis]|uniref:Uncharacterized protein n=1 Tax=Streptomyces marokkonensis TaxID=324855 RepID=A0ABW6Q812_9ACTN